MNARRRFDEEFEGFGEVVGEWGRDVGHYLLGLVALAGLGLLARWGWAQSRIGVIGTALALAPLAGYGLLWLRRYWTATLRPVRRRPLVLGVVATAVVVAGWLLYVVGARLE